MIGLSDVTKVFYKHTRNEILALDHVTFKTEDRGLIAILGHSGSGKSTLLNILGGLDATDQGQVTFADEIIGNRDDQVWDRVRREDIGYIFQNYHLLESMSVFDNVSLSLRLYGISDPVVIEKAVHYVLDAVGMMPYRKRRANQLSGGQKQRVAIARALVKNPTVVIADEPTGNLDSKNTREVMNIIKKISRDRLVLLVTHEEAIARFYGDRIITMKDGKITSDVKNDDVRTMDVDDDDTFHLKDYPFHDKDRLMRLYADDEDDQKRVSVTGVIKDGTLFIDALFPGGEVKLAEDAGVSFEDSHRKRSINLTSMETPYDPGVLEKSSKARHVAVFAGFKDAFKTAFLRLLSMTKKGKAMLFGFMLSGMIVAVSASVVGNALFNEEALVDELKPYVVLFKQQYQMPYEDIVAYGVDDPLFYMNLYDNPYLVVSVPSPFRRGIEYQLEGSIDLIDHVSEEDLFLGRMPENDYEILVDQNVFEQSDGTTMKLSAYGIWSVDLLIGEQIIKMDRAFTIVGITDTPAKRFYASRAGALLLAHDTLQPAKSFLPIGLVEDDLEVLHGRMPIEGSGEILAPSTWLGVFIDEDAFDDGQVPVYRNYRISGLYNPWPIHPEEKPFIGHIEDLERHIYQNTAGEIYLYSGHPEAMLESLREAGYTVSWPFMDKVNEARNTTVKMSPLIIISVLIVLFSGLGVYYMTRASMMPRMHDMAIRRALGTPAKTLEASFLVETLLLTSVTSIIGFAVGVTLVLRAQYVSSLQFLFYLNGWTIVMGVVVIYVSNVLFSHLSVHRELFKKPAELLSKIDM
ncbi:MAG: ABC transporter ATP-binding protein/permease [Acholeplasmataceae bacterium]|nr:ABC transporter ATP-binding protein/permease [Acholeplasmataceae bacterium]